MWTADDCDIEQADDRLKNSHIYSSLCPIRSIEQASHMILSDPANRFAPDGEEIVTLSEESRSKLDKDKVKPYNYTYQNSLYENFKPPSKAYLDQLERAKEVRKTMWRKTCTNHPVHCLNLDAHNSHEHGQSHVLCKFCGEISGTRISRPQHMKQSSSKLGNQSLIQPNPEDLPKDDPKLEIAGLLGMIGMNRNGNNAD
ncbi:hypothetical protein Tco_0174268 [Tanacetum coccineum]